MFFICFKTHTTCVYVNTLHTSSGTKHTQDALFPSQFNLILSHYMPPCLTGDYLMLNLLRNKYLEAPVRTLKDRQQNKLG